MAQINKPSDYFNTVLYTGNASTQSITGVGFQPDWVWVKDRTGANSHEVQDVVRGAGKGLLPNGTSAELTGRTLYQFDSDGFSLDGTNTTSNVNGNNYVAWNWLAGSTASSNTDGDITSSVSANTTSGFSIVSYTGTGSNATIGHGLGVRPSFIIVKVRDAVNSWPCQHISLGAGNRINLDSTAASASAPTFWNSTEPTSLVFSVGTEDITNNSGNTYIAYCFAEKKGFSKFGSYTGNGNTDGPFIYTGFKPAFLIIKQTNSANDWVTHDNKRDPYNGEVHYLHPNLSNAELTGGKLVDFTSNGFKQRSTQGSHNASGSTYIYMAFAENPLVGTNNIPATAR